MDQAIITQHIDNRLAQAETIYQQAGRPLVTLSYAQSLDGSIAVKTGSSLALSNNQALTLTHQLRATHQAILVGINTVLADNPRLSVRLAQGKNPQPVILDSQLRCPLTAKLLQNASLPLWIMTGQQAAATRQTELETLGAKIFRLEQDNDRKLNLKAVLHCLAKHGIRRLMVEGGAQVITSFLKARLVDQVVLTVTPVFVGGLQAVSQLGLTAQAELPHLQNLHHQFLGDNLILRGDPLWREI